MPINYMTPLDSLRSIPDSGFSSAQRRRVPGMGENIPGSLAGGNEFQAPDETQLLGLQQQRLSEMDDPRFQDRPDIAGLKRSLTGDIQENPLTQQAADVESYLGRRGKAVEQGFGGTNPVAEQAGYGRQQEERKLGMPLEVAKTNAAGSLAQEEARQSGALAVAKEKGTQTENMWDMLAKARAGGADIRGVNVAGSGGVSFGAPPKVSAIPTALINTLTAASQNLQRSGPTSSSMLHPFSGVPSPEKTAYDQALQAVFASSPASVDTKDLATEILNDPELKNLPTTAVMQHPKIRAKWNLDDVDPTELHQLDELIRYGRGQGE